MIVAVDGPSGAGKSSVCREVAKRMSWTLLDTGAIYRCVAYKALQNELSPTDAEGCARIARQLDLIFKPSVRGQRVILEGEDVSKKIRSFEVTQRVNLVSQMPEVRAELLEIQRQLGRSSNSIVEGRDIASVVFPDAELKIYYTASVDARAKRRMSEFSALKKGASPSFEEVIEQIKERDKTEFERKHSPLVQCDDAIVLDSSELNFEASCKALIALIQQRQATLGI